MNERIVAVDRVLGTVLAIRASILDAKLIPESIRNLAGIKLSEPDEPDEEPGGTPMYAEQEIQRASIDVRVLLRDVLAPYGLAIDSEQDDFLRLKGSVLPSGCELFFLMSNHTQPYAARPLTDAALCVVLHVNDKLPADYNAYAHTLGVHTVRLKDIGDITQDYLSTQAQIVSEVREASLAIRGPVDLLIETQRRVALAGEADPLKVEEYASTAQRDLFEAATAKIMIPITDGVIVLGSEQSGKTLPDGLLVQRTEQTGEPHEVLSYDCKSKQGDEYDILPKDIDQQSRYLQIQRSLGATKHWRGMGIILFSPTVDPDLFEEKALKGYTTNFTENKGKIVIVMASQLATWHRLTQGEERTAFRVVFQVASFWEALTRQKLPGLSEKDANRLFNGIGRSVRLMTQAEAELTWLAGLAFSSGVVDDLKKALEKTEASFGPAPFRPRIVQEFYTALGKKDADESSIAAKLGLTVPAVEYLTVCNGFKPSIDDLTPAGAKTYDKLRKKFRS